jgi:hypothetical protein
VAGRISSVSKLKVAPQFVFAIIHSKLQNARTFIRKKTSNLRILHNISANSRVLLKKMSGFIRPCLPPWLLVEENCGGPAPMATCRTPPRFASQNEAVGGRKVWGVVKKLEKPLLYTPKFVILPVWLKFLGGNRRFLEILL